MRFGPGARVAGRVGAGAEFVGPDAGSPGTLLLPQTSGMCGWGRWASAAAAQGVTSVLVDPCGHGDSVCDETGDADPLNEVAPAVEHARDVLGARRVVLVGTSMGGSLTVQAAAAGADVDGWVDVSGPSAWGGVEQRDLAADLPAGGMVVFARSDGDAEYASARRLADRSAARFVDGGGGHGWHLLTLHDGRLLAAGRAVLDHVLNSE